MAFPGTAWSAEARHVLMLHSYHSGMSWVENIEKGVYGTLFQAPYENVILHTEYMDTKRRHTAEHFANLLALYREKYKDVPISLILSSDNNAYDFLLEYKDDLFPGVPLVFCGVNDFDDASLEGVKGITGVAEIMSSRDTVEAILRLHPDTREIFVINDYLKTGRAWRATIERNLAVFKDRVRIAHNDDQPIDRLRKKIHSLKPGTIVLLGVYFSDSEGTYFTYEKLGSMLTSISPVPVYCLLRFNLRDGVVGGKVISGYHQGVMMADIARKVLGGEAPESIPVSNVGANAFIFDWQGMKKHGVDSSLLPVGSVILNEPFSFYNRYFKLVWAAIIVFATLSILVAVLVRNVHALRVVRRELLFSERKYRSIFDNATEGIFQSTKDGSVIAANDSMAAILGYESPRDAVDHLQNVRQSLYVHEEERRRLLAILDKKESVSNHVLQLKRKDGTPIWGNLNIRIATTPDGVDIYEGSLVDVTERKLARDTLLREKAKVEEANKALRTSMAHLRTLLEAIPELVWMKDAEGSYVFCNHRFERFFGAAEKDIVGRTDYDFVDRKLADLFRMNDRAAIEAGGSMINEETVTYNSDGHVEDLETIKAPIHDDDGNLLGVLGVGRDITARKAVEKELSRLRNYLSNIIDSMPSMLVGVDKEGRVTLWNGTAVEVTGVSSLGAQGRQVVDLLPGLASSMDTIADSIRTREPRREQRVPRGRSGEQRYEDITIYPLMADSGDNVVEGAVVRIDDVTDRVNLERMMVQSEKMMSLGGLAAGMAHEINNPLAGIIGSSQNLKNRLAQPMAKNDEVAQECGLSFDDILCYMRERGCMKLLNGMHEAALRAAAIVKDMLSFSRKSGTEFGRQNPVNLLEIALSLARNEYDLKKNYDFRKVEIVREFAADVPAIRCDANEMQQVLLNVLKNAAQAMAEKEYMQSGPRVVLRVYPHNGSVVMEIEDNGPGMEEDVRTRILEPFYTTKPVGTGTGLGLSVAYFITTELHGGTMEVFSEPGEWTRFVITLPVERAGNDGTG